MQSVDVPQQDDLGKVRAIVEALSNGVVRESLEKATGISPRHVRYTLHAARVLGWVRTTGAVWSATPSGRGLLCQTPGSDDELAWCRRAVAGTTVVREVVPQLLENPPLEAEDLAERLHTLTGLSRSTAHRRALTLMTWRHRLVPDAAELAPPEPAVVPAPEPAIEETEELVDEPVLVPFPDDDPTQMSLF